MAIQRNLNFTEHTNWYNTGNLPVDFLALVAAARGAGLFAGPRFGGMFLDFTLIDV